MTGGACATGALRDDDLAAPWPPSTVFCCKLLPLPLPVLLLLLPLPLPVLLLVVLVQLLQLLLPLLPLLLPLPRQEIAAHAATVASLDLRSPHSWYPFARALQRKIVYHGGEPSAIALGSCWGHQDLD
jgi:hypothetical protein